MHLMHRDQCGPYTEVLKTSQAWPFLLLFPGGFLHWGFYKPSPLNNTDSANIFAKQANFVAPTKASFLIAHQNRLFIKTLYGGNEYESIFQID